MDQKEFDKLEEILHTFWKDGLLTDIDCRIIASYDNLLERKAAVYTVILSKTKEEAAILIEAFRKKSKATDVKENGTNVNNSSSIEENNSSILTSRNPLMNNTILDCLFGFLPLDDLKTSTLVCRAWNPTAVVCLRKRSSIKFRPNGLHPRTFMAISKYSYPDLPFRSFVFSIDDTCRWQMTKVQDFFEKWGKNIKEVTFDYIALTRKCNLEKKQVVIPNYNATPLFINPSNITCLIIRHTPHYERRTMLEISLEKFVSMKTLFLGDCRIIVSPENQCTRIAPLNIDFFNITCMQNGEPLYNFHYNDLVDLSKAVNINLSQMSENGAILDMGKHVFNLNQLHLTNVTLKNWARAKGDVQFLNLNEIAFEEKTNLRIRQLEFVHSKIDLTALPITLEFLNLPHIGAEITSTHPAELPNLKYLLIDVNFCDSLTHFSNCTNLKELEICNSEPSSGPYTLSVGNIPKSVQRIRMKYCQLKFNDNCTFELDSLILECTINRSIVNECIAITTQIKAKVLVIDLNCDREIDTLDIVRLIQINEQAQKILISSATDLLANTPYEENELPEGVKSNVYQFENGVGKSIPMEEFQKCFKRVDYFPPHFNPNAAIMNLSSTLPLLLQ